MSRLCSGNEENHRKPHELDFSMVLASSVHDMKNSLGMLLNSLEEMIVETPPQSDEQKQRFSVLKYEAYRINLELIQLLTIYRFQEDKLPFNIDENYIFDTFEDQIARNDGLFDTRGVELSVDCDSDLAWFYDNELVGNVIHNVLINSSRYARSKVHLSASVKEERLVIVIEDDGSGFPEFMLNSVAPDASNLFIDNTQLGLFFADKIAHFHCKGDSRGYIKLENGGKLGGGIFSIFLP